MYLDKVSANDILDEFLLNLSTSSKEQQIKASINYSLSSGLVDCLLDLDTKLARNSRGQIHQLLTKHAKIWYRNKNKVEFVQKEVTINKSFDLVDKIASLLDSWSFGFEAKVLVASLALYEFMLITEATFD